MEALFHASTAAVCLIVVVVVVVVVVNYVVFVILVVIVFNGIAKEGGPSSVVNANLCSKTNEIYPVYPLHAFS